MSADTTGTGLEPGRRAIIHVRLALREENDFWVAYLAGETMDNAVKLGSIAMQLIETNQERKLAFMDLMKGIVAEAVEQITGSPPSSWHTQAAPEYERSK